MVPKRAELSVSLKGPIMDTRSISHHRRRHPVVRICLDQEIRPENRGDQAMPRRLSQSTLMVNGDLMLRFGL